MLAYKHDIITDDMYSEMSQNAMLGCFYDIATVNKVVVVVLFIVLYFLCGE